MFCFQLKTLSAYCISKSGLDAFTRCLALGTYKLLPHISGRQFRGRKRQFLNRKVKVGKCHAILGDEFFRICQILSHPLHRHFAARQNSETLLPRLYMLIKLKIRVNFRCFQKFSIQKCIRFTYYAPWNENFPKICFSFRTCKNLTNLVYLKINDFQIIITFLSYF